MLAGLSWAATALAADVELDIPRLEGERQQQLQARALQAAFTRAVYDEALDILPGELQPLRRELLYDFLSSRSAKFIQGYSDVSHEPIPGGVRIYAKVAVNRGDLKKMLHDLGMFYTVDAFLPYTLALGEGAGFTGEEITRLQFLSGLSSIHGARPKLTLQRASTDVWTGHLESEAGEWRSRSSDLETLWITLWGNYFSRTGMAAKGKKALSVQVAGWKTPEDIHGPRRHHGALADPHGQGRGGQGKFERQALGPGAHGAPSVAGCSGRYAAGSRSAAGSALITR